VHLTHFADEPRMVNTSHMVVSQFSFPAFSRLLCSGDCDPMSLPIKCSKVEMTEVGRSRTGMHGIMSGESYGEMTADNESVDVVI
jgi:hypothetical protein